MPSLEPAVGERETMRSSTAVGAGLVASLTVSVSSAMAQSLQRFSLQGSGAVLFATTKDQNYESKRRLGFEAQARYTFGRFSLGAGYQRSTVFAFVNNPLTIALSFGFVEPRFVLTAKGGVGFYLAGRLGAGKLVCSQSGVCNLDKTAVGYGGGGGLLFRFSRRLTGDLGTQYFQIRGDLPSRFAMVRAGLGLGL